MPRLVKEEPSEAGNVFATTMKQELFYATTVKQEPICATIAKQEPFPPRL